MKISELIAGLANTLASKGDLDVFFCGKDKDSNNLRSVALVCGGWVNNTENNPIAFVSNDNLESVIPNEQ